MADAYRIVDIDLSRPLPPLTLSQDEAGLGIVARSRRTMVGFEMLDRATVEAAVDAGRSLLDGAFGLALLKTRIRDELEAGRSRPAVLPSVTAAICTKDRPERLSRLLASLDALAPAPPGAPPLDILVVDNAPSSDATRALVNCRAGTRYVLEPKPGLDFARNTALANARGDLLAFLDDDVTVDRYWLDGLYEAWSHDPEAGAFTGLVLPFALGTTAQRLFESRGGFGRGFSRDCHRQEKLLAPLYPSAAGVFGAGCNMAFQRFVLVGLGGFDEALDTGRPLPGGGDLDIFYRVVRSGRAIVYEPSYAVYHEHRQTLSQLRHQYWTWGLGFMAFLTKCRRSDPELRRQNRAITRWWFMSHFVRVLRALGGASPLPASHELAEWCGGILGVFGEYHRSQRRIDRIARAHR